MFHKHFTATSNVLPVEVLLSTCILLHAGPAPPLEEEDDDDEEDDEPPPVLITTLVASVEVTGVPLVTPIAFTTAVFT